MKKLFAVLALVGVMTSCKDKKKDEKKPEETTVTTPPADNTTPPADVAPVGDVPKFADAEVQKYVDDYTTFVSSYVAAYKSKDMTKVADLASKMTEWSGKSASVMTKLAGNADEATKFSTYMTKLSQDWANAAQVK